jgi:hypothetical protein
MFSLACCTILVGKYTKGEIDMQKLFGTADKKYGKMELYDKKLQVPISKTFICTSLKPL